MTVRGPARSDALVKAAVWLLYLKPEPAHVLTKQVRRKHDVAKLLRTSSASAVQALVRDAGAKRLGDLLTGQHRRDVLLPSWRVLGETILWAQKAGLPIIPIEKIAETAPEVGLFPRAFGRMQPLERDVWTLLLGLPDLEVTMLTPTARKAFLRIVVRLIRRLAQLADTK